MHTACFTFNVSKSCTEGISFHFIKGKFATLLTVYYKANVGAVTFCNRQIGNKFFYQYARLYYSCMEFSDWSLLK